LHFRQLIASYQEFVPNAGKTTCAKFDLPVLSNCAEQFKGRLPGNCEGFCLACLKQWEPGSPMRQTSRQKLWGGINWAVQRGHLNTIFSPPASLPETQKLKRVGCPLDATQIPA
jgi:hypothetical protein